MPVAVDVMLVPAALGDTLPMYLKMVDNPAPTGKLMPGMSFGELPLDDWVAVEPNVSMSTPADSDTCTCVPNPDNRPFNGRVDV